MTTLPYPPRCFRRCAARFVCVTVLLGAESLWGAASTSWEVAGYNEYLKGRMRGLMLTADGILKPGRPLRWQTGLGQPALWSLALGPDGSVYAATGHTGKVIRINRDGKSTLAWQSDQSEVFALTADSDGTIWAGTSPSGGLYKINNGRAVQVWASPEKYIWAILPAPDGSFFVGTGENGRIYHVDRSGKASLFYETGQANVTALAAGDAGSIYAGTDPNGLLYQITGPGTATVLYDSTLPEIRAIIRDPEGNLYAAGMGGALSTRTAPPSGGTTAPPTPTITSATPTVVTVTEAAAGNSGENAQNSPNVAASAQRGQQTPSTVLAGGTATSVTEVAGVERSAIYRIRPDRTVETLRSSKEDNVYDLLWDRGRLVFSTDDNGRVYQWQDGKTSLLAELGTGETTRLLRQEDEWRAAMSNPARVVALGPEETSAVHGDTWFESQVHDSGSVARWGHLLWRPAGGQVHFRTRTGNALRPDATWSSWSEPMTDPQRALIASPIARYIQWRAEWPNGAPVSNLNAVSLAYLPQNAPPVVRSVTASSVLGANAAKGAATTASSAAAYSITVTESGETSASSSTTSGPSQTASRLQSTQTQISWQADDPDGDKLVYSLYFRPEDASEWQLIRSRMFENALLLDPDVLADGRYMFKVVASDSPANAAPYARSTEYVSPPVLVDNTPPLVTITSTERSGATADLVIAARDQTSALKRAEYSLDAGWWQTLEAVDGITDTSQEEFRVHAEKLKPGEHLVVIRVFDAAGNAGLAKALLR